MDRLEIGACVWAKRRGRWSAATVLRAGKKSCLVEFFDSEQAYRDTSGLQSRNPWRCGNDRPDRIERIHPIG